MQRAPRASYRWALTLFPTQAYAAEAGMSLRRVRGLLLRAPACATDARPGRRPGSASRTRSSAWPSGSQGKEEVHITGPGTDLTLGVAGPHLDRRATGEHNMPDGEFFTGPVEDSVERRGRLLASRPSTAAARWRACKLRFEDGKVVDASAERGEEFLIEMLDTDEGARRLGELGIGTNYGIATGTKEILLDEKIGGTVHLAIGMSLSRDRRRRTDSAVHWDMVCDLRQGGAITVDGEELQRDGSSWSFSWTMTVEPMFRMAIGDISWTPWRVIPNGRRSSTRRRRSTPSAAQLFTKLDARDHRSPRARAGETPRATPSLALAIQKARDAAMPKDNIERAVAKGTGADADADAFETVLYEGYGPGGVAILVEALTDNRNRTGSEVRHTFTKHGGNLGEPGSVAWTFEKKGEMVVDGGRYSEDDLLPAIDAGAEDVALDGDVWEIVTGPADARRRARCARGGRGGDRVRRAAMQRPTTRTPVEEDRVGER